MVEKTLNDLFHSQLKGIYYAEKKIYRTLPKMAKATTLPELKQAFMAHREETQGHRFQENIGHGEPRRHCANASDRQVLLAALPPGEARH
jgi:ferritin-like metal-binding protein YciE